MTRRIPVVATLVVLAAAGIMIALGFWQLGRLHEKEALIARAQANLRATDLATPNLADEENWYRPVRQHCDKVLSITPRAGRSHDGRSGWVFVAHCMTGGRTPDDLFEPSDVVVQQMDVTLGWAEAPRAVAWQGGWVAGRVAPAHEKSADPLASIGRIIADPPLAGLAANASPDPRELPNNHLSYAVQWFLFAATALVIYALALRKRWRASAA